MDMIGDFKKFALRGNLIDMAVGFTVGAAFTSVAKSLVTDIIMPPLGFLLGKSDFSDLFIVLNSPDPERTYTTLAQAQEAGLTTVNYGLFINNIIAFMLVAFAMFLIIRLINQLDKKLEDTFGGEKSQPGDPENKKCPYCLSTIPYRATRCAHCTAELPATEQTPATDS